MKPDDFARGGTVPGEPIFDPTLFAGGRYRIQPASHRPGDPLIANGLGFDDLSEAQVAISARRDWHGSVIVDAVSGAIIVAPVS
jgi:hypothetical protein